ncbi:BgTH12-00259 [Blumeria graminis f. sp. triticale]|uniref:BgTH12-00259 n=1 Tax=Blumeria graminis f. sp. triticale TaxID=1689686 RepID=A0A9W4GH73_BLUGR|nr:BgTH12-00259 [Blumeria graminis f. sp. triticale]
MSYYPVTPNTWSYQKSNPEYHTLSPELIPGLLSDQTFMVGRNLQDPINNNFQSKISQDSKPSECSRQLRSNVGSSPCDYILDYLVSPSLNQNRLYQTQPAAKVAANSPGASTDPRVLSQETRLNFKSENLLDVENQEDSWEWEYENIFKDPPVAETVALAQPLAVAFKSTPVPLMQPCSKLGASISRYARKENLKEFTRSIRSTPQWSYMQEDPAFSDNCLDGQLIPLDQIHTWTASRHGKNQLLEILSERYADRARLKRTRLNETNDLDLRDETNNNPELDNISTKRHRTDYNDEKPKDVIRCVDTQSSTRSRKSAKCSDTAKFQTKNTAVSVSACSTTSSPTTSSHISSTQKIGKLSKQKFHHSNLSRLRCKKSQTLVSNFNSHKDISMHDLPDSNLSLDQQPKILDTHDHDKSLIKCENTDHGTHDPKTLHQQNRQQLNKSYSRPQNIEIDSSQPGRIDPSCSNSSIASSCIKLLGNARKKSCKKELAFNPNLSLDALFYSRNSAKNERPYGLIRQTRHSTNSNDAPLQKQFVKPNNFEEKKKLFTRQPPSNNANEDRHNFAKQHGPPLKDKALPHLHEQVIHRYDQENVESFISKKTIPNLVGKKVRFLEKCPAQSGPNNSDYNFGLRQQSAKLESSSKKQGQSDLQDKNIGQVNGLSNISSIEYLDKITVKSLGSEQSNRQRDKSAKILRKQPKVEEAYRYVKKVKISTGTPFLTLNSRRW